MQQPLGFTQHSSKTSIVDPQAPHNSPKLPYIAYRTSSIPKLVYIFLKHPSFVPMLCIWSLDTLQQPLTHFNSPKSLFMASTFFEIALGSYIQPQNNLQQLPGPSYSFKTLYNSPGTPFIAYRHPLTVPSPQLPHIMEWFPGYTFNPQNSLQIPYSASGHSLIAQSSPVQPQASLYSPQMPFVCPWVPHMVHRRPRAWI